VAQHQTHPVRRALKAVADAMALLVATPFGGLSALEKQLLPGHESTFQMCAQAVALLPGLPGVFVRRAFYRYALDACDADCHIGFGALVTHRQTIIERGVYVGVWALVGSAHLREGTSVGSRASLLSGTDLHEYHDGQWTPADVRKLRQIVLGPHAFIGEAAVVMADVGAGAMVATGAVVPAAVPAGIVVAGNPARFVRRLAPYPATPPAVDAATARSHEALPQS
jgi:virginiamycin A acetyltransferase